MTCIQDLPHPDLCHILLLSLPPKYCDAAPRNTALTRSLTFPGATGPGGGRAESFRFSDNLLEGLHRADTVPCETQGRGFFGRADSIVYISRQGMTSLDLCLQLIPPGQGNQPRRQQSALAGLASPRNHRREAGSH